MHISRSAGSVNKKTADILGRQTKKERKRKREEERKEEREGEKKRERENERERERKREREKERERENELKLRQPPIVRCDCCRQADAFPQLGRDSPSHSNLTPEQDNMR